MTFVRDVHVSNYIVVDMTVNNAVCALHLLNHMVSSECDKKVLIDNFSRYECLQVNIIAVHSKNIQLSDEVLYEVLQEKEYSS
jgi:hypothetical protein